MPTLSPEEDGDESDARRLAGDRVALAFLILGALIRILALVETGRYGLELRGHYNLDAYNYHRRAARVAAGDWAMKERYDYSGKWPDEPGHPRFSFAIWIMGEKRYDEEFGPRTYFDYPGYPYFVAPFYAAFGTETRTVLFAQEALDLLGCALIYLMARRLFDRTVARVALGLVVLFGPLVFFAAFLLRDSLITSLHVFVLYLAVRARSTRGWILLGLVLGLAWIVKGSVLLLAPFLVFRGGWRGAAAFALGAALGVAPFAARNVALGVPPLRMSTVEEASLLIFNAPVQGVRGQHYENVELARHAAEKCVPLSNLGALKAAIAEHPSFGDFARQCGARLYEHYRADDAWDNVRFSYLAPSLISTNLAPVRWKFIEGFAAVGLLLALADWRRKLVLFGPIAENVVMASIGLCLARYRLHAEPVHAILAAFAAVWMLREARRRRAVALYAALAGVVVTLVLHDAWPLPNFAMRRSYVAGTFGEEAARALVDKESS